MNKTRTALLRDALLVCFSLVASLLTQLPSAQAAALEYGRQRLGQLRSDVGFYLLEGTARGHSVEVLAWWDATKEFWLSEPTGYVAKVVERGNTWQLDETNSSIQFWQPAGRNPRRSKDVLSIRWTTARLSLFRQLNSFFYYDPEMETWEHEGSFFTFEHPWGGGTLAWLAEEVDLEVGGIDWRTGKVEAYKQVAEPSLTLGIITLASLMLGSRKKKEAKKT